jgi:hypothetical protein
MYESDEDGKEAVEQTLPGISINICEYSYMYMYMYICM